MTGMRLGESLALRWQDIDPAAKMIHIHYNVDQGRLQVPKSKASRRAIEVGDQLLAILASHRRAQYGEATPLPEAFVFPTSTGGPMDPSNVRKRVWDPTLQRLGLTGIRIHDLRHFYASALLQQGESVVYVAKQLGHGSPAITLKVYAHVLPTERRAANRLEQGLAALRDTIPTPLAPEPGETGAHGGTDNPLIRFTRQHGEKRSDTPDTLPDEARYFKV